MFFQHGCRACCGGWWKQAPLCPGLSFFLLRVGLRGGGVGPDEFMRCRGRTHSPFPGWRTPHPPDCPGGSRPIPSISRHAACSPRLTEAGRGGGLQKLGLLTRGPGQLRVPFPLLSALWGQAEPSCLLRPSRAAPALPGLLPRSLAPEGSPSMHLLPHSPALSSASGDTH